jgi:hypothetical protein
VYSFSCIIYYIFNKIHLAFFCCEKESVLHLFCECAVSIQFWKILSDIFQIQVVCSFDSIGQYWLSDKKFVVLNMVTSAALCGIWKLRNEILDQNVGWKGMDILIKQGGNIGTELDNPVSREQEGNTNQDYWGAQKAGLYGSSSMASSMMGEDLGACLKNHQMLDAVQECLMMKPELVV